MKVYLDAVSACLIPRPQRYMPVALTQPGSFPVTIGFYELLAPPQPKRLFLQLEPRYLREFSSPYVNNLCQVFSLMSTTIHYVILNSSAIVVPSLPPFPHHDTSTAISVPGRDEYILPHTCHNQHRGQLLPQPHPIAWWQIPLSYSLGGFLPKYRGSLLEVLLPDLFQ